MDRGPQCADRHPMGRRPCRSHSQKLGRTGRARTTGDTSGFLGGGQVGCNLQIGGNWVIGVEAEASAANIEGDITQTVLGITGTARAQTDWLAAATGRIGWNWERWLIYAKGGAAWAGDKYSAFIPVFNEFLEANETRTGWVV